MAMTVIEFLEHTRGLRHESEATCGECGKPISYEEVRAEDVQYTSKGIAHSDCYCDLFGKLIDQHPIDKLGIHGPGVIMLDESDFFTLEKTEEPRQLQL